MGRSKQIRPIKRRRVVLEADDFAVAEEQTTFAEQGQKHPGGEEELAAAIALLRKTPQDRVEAAAAEATRLDLARRDRWIHLRLPHPSSSLPTTTTIATVFEENDRLPTPESLPIQNTSTTTPTETTNHLSSEDATIEPSTATLFASSVPSWMGGLGFARLADTDFVALRKLHQAIKDRVNNNTPGARPTSPSGHGGSSSKLEWASWSGSAEDPRKRAFGFLPGTWVRIPTYE